MPYAESRSICSRSRSKRNYKAGRKIGRKGHHFKHQTHKNRVLRKRKNNYSPEYCQKQVDRLYYSDEHKPSVEQQE